MASGRGDDLHIGQKAVLDNWVKWNDIVSMKETLSPDLLVGMALFAQVVDAGGVSAAAKSMGLSKSAVSKQLAALEDRLGARLLNRTTRRMSLTEAGAAFLESCRRVVVLAEEAEAAMGALQVVPRGVLRVNAPMVFGTMHLAPLIPEFLALYPHITLDLVLNDRFVDLLEEGFDVAVRIGRLEDSSLMARRLAPAKRIIAAAPDYLRRMGTPQDLADLSRHQILSYSLVKDEWSFAENGQVRSVKAESRLRANNGEALLHAALGGAGIVSLPTFIIGDALRQGRLVRILPHLENADLAIHAVWPSGRHLSAKVRAFVDFLAQRLGPLPAWDREG